jgi:hypothetical protein
MKMLAGRSVIVLPYPNGEPRNVSAAEPDAEAADDVSLHVTPRVGHPRNETHMHREEHRKPRARLLRGVSGRVEETNLAGPESWHVLAPVHWSPP